MAARKKRKGTIALDAARPMTVAAQSMVPGAAEVFVDYINRWLDNGHNLDADDIRWLAAVATLVAYNASRSE